MKYLGSKNRIAKHILPIMLEDFKINNRKVWVEPFVGGGNMIDKVPKEIPRFGGDSNEHAIQSLIAIRDCIAKLPDSLTEKEYKLLKGENPHPVNSWLRFVASFGGKLDGGYARETGSDETTFISYGKRNAQKQSPKIQGVKLITADYKDFYKIDNCLIYCDPPYCGTTPYKTEKFNHSEFWEWCRFMSKNNSVFISEYNAPNDFVCVWEGGVKTNLASQREKATHDAKEKLFKLSKT